MAVLNTTSPTAAPRAPMERPRKTVPSARTSTAASVLSVIPGADVKSGRGTCPSRFIEAGIIRGGLAQAKDVAHVVQARRPAFQILGSAQGAHRVRHAALGAHRDFDPFPQPREEDGVLAHD